ncbi:MAG TPA: toll/interleukin-1 receptor domain-containing protein [Ktedonobacteraceae bacterium]|nr:toll/interleukin-1 receptor domain-containing protein [Ktedonobacteraceae bacterium]
MPTNLEVFLCYAHEDELLCKELVIYLAGLKRQGFFDLWYDREIGAGMEYEQENDKHLNTAHIILLLVSQYFMNSNYCYLVEMQRAIERHERGDARVIPVLLRPVYFQRAPFAKLMSLPTNKKPITDSSWHSIDEAFFDVAEGIRKTAEELAIKLSVNSPIIPQSTSS